MKLIVTRYRTSVEFLACYQDGMEHGGVFVPRRNPLMSGEQVILDIRMPNLQDSVMIRGQVVWSRRGRRSTGHRAGMGVEFSGTESQKRDYLLAIVRGKRAPANRTRRYSRLPMPMPGDWRIIEGNTRHPCMVSDIGSGGAFLQTRNVVPTGTSVILEVATPGSTTQHAIEGRVAWSSDVPGNRGMGIEFRTRDMAGKRRIRELVRRIEASLTGESTG